MNIYVLWYKWRFAVSAEGICIVCVRTCWCKSTTKMFTEKILQRLSLYSNTNSVTFTQQQNRTVKFLLFSKIKLFPFHGLKALASVCNQFQLAACHIDNLPYQDALFTKRTTPIVHISVCELLDEIRCGHLGQT